MKINKQIDVNVPAEKAWEILQDIGTVDQWISSVHHSKAFGTGKNATRTCETDLGPFKETITIFDADRMQLSYEAKGEKMPFFVKRLANNWKIKSLNTNSCRVLMCLECDIMGAFNVFPGPMMKMKFNSILNDAINEFKHYVETGEPAATKVKAMQKAKKKMAKAA